MSLTTAQAAALAGVSPRTIRRWIEKGALPAQSGAGGVLYVFAADVETARLAGLSRSPRPSPLSARFTVVEDNNAVPELSGTSQVSPDPAGTAAGAILVAWRDTVLAPVVEELSATRRELGEVRQELGRAQAERDQAQRERSVLQEQLAVFEAGELRSAIERNSPDLTHAPQDANAAPQRDDTHGMADMTLRQARDVPQPAGESVVRRWWRKIVGG